MNLSATGIIIDHYGDILLIQRDDTHTLAPPGGAAEIGELPTETVAREVREETGLIVMPVRLVGMYFVTFRSKDYLSLTFRCIMRGGEISTSHESPKAGFFKTDPFPNPMLNFHKERIEKSLSHHGGPPYWGTHSVSWRLRLVGLALNYIVYPWLDFRRRSKGSPRYQPPPNWIALASVIVRDEHDQVLWIKSSPDSAEWMLPTIRCASGQSPWEAAVQMFRSEFKTYLELLDVSGIYTDQNEAKIAFSFIGRLVSSTSDQLINTNADFFAAGEEPPHALSQHILQVQDAQNSEQEITYRLISED
ncbi:MAG: NUDIX domain-containing protein [Candidatus Promineifilaceae bacterium]|nr:NUDIX domain-containing protein [Candidatus Promineifilaceae bacterium]